MAKIDSDTLNLQFEYGEVLEADLATGKRKLVSAQDELDSLRETLFKVRLQAVGLIGESVSDSVNAWVE